MTAIFFVGFVLFLVYLAVRTIRYRRKVRERDKRVRTASAEAAEDDAYFEASGFEAHARGLFVACQEAWDARDTERLAALVGPDLLVEWKRRLGDFRRKGWHNRVSVSEPPKVQYVGLVNREDDDSDRAVARPTASLKAYVVDRDGRKVMREEEKDEDITLCEYWTLARRGDVWTVVSIEQRRGRPPPGQRDTRLAVVGHFVAAGRVPDRAGRGGRPATGLHESRTGRGRFRRRRPRPGAGPLPGRRPLRARRAGGQRPAERWRPSAEAVGGSGQALTEIATPQAMAELLYVGDESRETRLVVRGPGVRRIHIAAVDVESEPATMTVKVEVAGRRYVEDRDTAAVVSGCKDRATSWTEPWTLELDGSAETPWKLRPGSQSRRKRSARLS